MSASKPCKDCLAEGVNTIRKAATKPDGSPVPGNRCVTHHRARRKAASLAAHAQRVEKGFGITGEQYWALYEAQGGRCWICRKASGKARRLAVDHDHETGLVRGLLCGPDNITIGRLRKLGLVNALTYLHDPPAVHVIGHVYVPLTTEEQPDGSETI